MASIGRGYHFLGKIVAITSDMQLPIDPVLNPDEDQIWVKVGTKRCVA